MRRLVITLIVVFLAASALTWWADHPGQVSITWEAWQINTSFAILIVLLALAVAIALLLQSFYMWVKYDLPFVGKSRHLHRQQKGLESLNRAIVALASGDGAAARKFVHHAQKFLPPQPMMRVVAAQAAKLSGDHEIARKEFEALTGEETDAAFLGVRGLLIEAIADGREHEALDLAERARALDPKSSWAIKTHFNLLVAAGDWVGAKETLNSAKKVSKKSRVFSQTVADGLMATLLYCQAKEADLGNDKKTAVALANKALHVQKGFLPAALLTARLYRDDGKTSKAARVLENAWRVEPHPELAAAYVNLMPTETATARLRRFKKLTGKKESAEGLLQLADRALEADHLTEAREYAERALKKTNRARAFTVMKVIQERLGVAPAVVEKWAEQEQGGTPEPVWACQSCGAKAERWSLHCPACRMFNTLIWEGESPVKRSKDSGSEDFLVVLSDPTKSAGSFPFPDDRSGKTKFS